MILHEIFSTAPSHPGFVFSESCPKSDDEYVHHFGFAQSERHARIIPDKSNVGVIKCLNRLLWFDGPAQVEECIFAPLFHA